jgi:hypothetical protein
VHYLLSNDANEESWWQVVAEEASPKCCAGQSANCHACLFVPCLITPIPGTFRFLSSYSIIVCCAI